MRMVMLAICMAVLATNKASNWSSEPFKGPSQVCSHCQCHLLLVVDKGNIKTPRPKRGERRLPLPSTRTSSFAPAFQGRLPKTFFSSTFLQSTVEPWKLLQHLLLLVQEPKDPLTANLTRRQRMVSRGQIALAKTFCESFFGLQYLLSNTSGKQVSKGGVVNWLLQQAKGGIEALQKHHASMAAGGGVGHASTARGPGSPTASSKWPVPQILFDASPGRLAVLGKRDIDWDEMLGYITMEDFDNDPDLQEVVQEEVSPEEFAGGSASLKTGPTVFYA
jgi:hypothetical protein